MCIVRRPGLTALVLACCVCGSARAGWGVGVQVGGPYPPYYGPYYRPYWGVGVGVYATPPVYVAPPPVVVSPPPVAGQPVPAPPAPVYVTPPPAVAAPPAPAVPTRQDQIDDYIDQLSAPQEDVRINALLQLGRLDARRASIRMVRVLQNDPSPRVRETAAQALGMIGVPHTLAPLQRAAQIDPDPGVRNSASAAASSMRGPFRLRRFP